MINIHYDGNKDDEEGISDSDGTEDGCFFYKKIPHKLEENPEIKH